MSCSQGCQTSYVIGKKELYANDASIFRQFRSLDTFTVIVFAVYVRVIVYKNGQKLSIKPLFHERLLNEHAILQSTTTPLVPNFISNFGNIYSQKFTSLLFSFP